MPSWAELELFLSDRPRPYRLREDAEIEHVHWATTRRSRYDELTVLAIDHRSLFEDLARDCGVGGPRIAAFKMLALKAVDQVAQGDRRFGILLDGRHGMRALEAAADTPYWIGRPIELPQSCPLEFEASADVGAEIAQWPLNHVVKCLAHYHPDDAEELRRRQERQMLRLFDACRKTRHELLVEIIASKNGPVDSMTAARAVQLLYDRGIRPDWWKLEPAPDASVWANIERTIAANDPYCRGVVLLGLSVTKERLLEAFEAARDAKLVRGFAVGRSIFNGAAEQYFKGEIDDRAAIAGLASNLSELVEAWRTIKARASQP
jgi:5-dehydro-2-deoxygluconokinase